MALRMLMAPRKRPCVECGRLRERCRNVVKTVQGLILWVCPGCWRSFGYGEFFHPEGCDCPHCRVYRTHYPS